MNEELIYYVAFNGGLRIMETRKGSFNTLGEFFAGRTLEHLTGCQRSPEVVFAAVAFDGGYRIADGGRSWRKVLEGEVRTFPVDPTGGRVGLYGIGHIPL